ncbi:MAG TPA: hypothetical protein VGH72_33880 [Pseudonocardia sp.]
MTDALQTALTDLTSVTGDVVAELSSLSSQLQAALASGDTAALQSAADQIETQVGTLRTALASATPAPSGSTTGAPSTGGDTSSAPQSGGTTSDTTAAPEQPQTGSPMG